MPLYPNARDLLRNNLDQIAAGGRPRLVPIGTLTVVQLAVINAEHLARGFDPMIDEVVFLGRHIYLGRVLKDGYSIADVSDQISSGMDPAAIMSSSRYMTAMENPNPRPDRYGNLVRDRAVFECSARHPRPELFSILPKGDFKKPPK
jgi:hypothetical protein